MWQYWHQQNLLEKQTQNWTGNEEHPPSSAVISPTVLNGCFLFGPCRTPKTARGQKKGTQKKVLKKHTVVVFAATDLSLWCRGCQENPEPYEQPWDGGVRGQLPLLRPAGGERWAGGVGGLCKPQEGPLQREGCHSCGDPGDADPTAEPWCALLASSFPLNLQFLGYMHFLYHVHGVGNVIGKKKCRHSTPFVPLIWSVVKKIFGFYQLNVALLAVGL